VDELRSAEDGVFETIVVAVHEDQDTMLIRR
jgi:hypothetical protein